MHTNILTSTILLISPRLYSHGNKNSSEKQNAIESQLKATHPIKIHFQVKPILGKMGKLTMGSVYWCGNPK